MKDVHRLVEKLGALRDGDEAATELLAAGAAAVEQLRLFLLEGAPATTFRPRQRAAEVLGALGAKDVLLEYLRQPRVIPDADTRLAEEAVQITAARELKRWHGDSEVQAAMLGIAAKRFQPGVIETLGASRRPEAIPYFVLALEDDVCRRAAEEALYELGAQAKEALVEAALTRLPSPEEESPSSLRRRRSALNLLGKMLLQRRYWRALWPCVNEKDAGVVAAASRLAAKLGNAQDKKTAAYRLIESLPAADSFLQREIEDVLVALWPEAEAIVNHQAEERRASRAVNAPPDPVLQSLARVLDRAAHHRAIRK